MRGLALLAVLVTTSCLHSSAILCSDGSVCPEATICNIAERRCDTPQVLAPCAGKPELASCTNLAGAAGICDAGLCVVASCGDGLTSTGEACDDGNLDSGDGCRGDCRSDETCGNAVLDPQTGEECDCGASTLAPGCAELNSSTSSTALCGANCRLRCGDGNVDAYELCDGAPPAGESCVAYGFDAGTLACTSVCTPGFAGCERFDWRLLPQSSDAAYVDVWGTSPSDLYAVSRAGTITHWDGITWQVMFDGPDELLGIWGRAGDDVYAVGDGGTIVHYDGVAWTAMDSGTFQTLFDVGGSALGVFVVGSDQLVLRNTGAAWTVASGDGGGELRAVYARDDGVWAVGRDTLLAFDPGASTWTEHTSGAIGSANGVYATSTTIYISSTFGVFRSPRSAFAISRVGASVDPAYALWGAGDDALFVVGPDAMHYWDGTAWLRASRDRVFGVALWGLARDRVYAVGDGAYGIRTFSGTAWSAAKLPTANTYTAVARGGAGVLAVGAGSVVRYVPTYGNAVAWQPRIPPSGETLSGLWASPTSDDVFVAGTSGVVSHTSGTTGAWTARFSMMPGDAVHAIWGASAEDVFAVGSNTTIARGGATAPWTAQSLGSATPLLGVWGAGATDVFACGESGYLTYFDGATWSRMTSPTQERLNGIWGTSATNVFAVGREGTIVRYDGASWSAMASGTNQHLESISGTGPDDVFAVGHDVVLHFDGIAWSPIRDARVDVVNQKMRAVLALPDRVFVLGSATSELLLRP